MDAIKELKKNRFEITTLDLKAKQNLNDFKPAIKNVYILGNETEGVSPEILNQADNRIIIPMKNGVESLNVAITSALIAFKET